MIAALDSFDEWRILIDQLSGYVEEYCKNGIIMDSMELAKYRLKAIILRNYTTS